MEKFSQLKIGILLTVIGSVGLSACNSDGSDNIKTGSNQAQSELTDCMWQDAVSSQDGTGGENPMNYALPDSNVSYWSSEFSVPEGAKVLIDGDYPYARHTSLVSYTAQGERVNSLVDVNIQPNQGVTNPFIVGNNRLNKERGYKAELVLGDLPTSPKENTLYAPKTDSNDVALIYRVYVPNKGFNVKGGVDFPRFKVQLANGEVKTGTEVCNVLKVKKKVLDNVKSPLELVLSLYDKQPHEGFPAQVIPTWYTAYNRVANLRCLYKYNLDQCEGFQTERELNQWATPDNEYTFSVISRKLGKVVVLKGKVPQIAATSGNETTLAQGDIRYWSICTNELITTATNFCIYDEQIKQKDKDGFYTIVVSLPEDRPTNATEQCGITYLPLSERGDGYTGPDAIEKGHNDVGFLIMRNLLPYPDFNQAIQNTKIWGDEKTVMGDYLPDISYTTKADFEAKGCP
ncbi:hypothetical protein EAH57_13410 [Acinetobacter sp. 2JN-4]|uniref:hypothetical protein n=1 Tax=Acinetobacter sp. 2JN-4 TaxID=2479844 RepID=UPI000EF9E915|nr:hypothetical protein [Acinetobacter sp. 2JN-4]RLZ07216.1 hypothetical protein EAH57_13410 [Acinetobacter sp. 2JN-4]